MKIAHYKCKFYKNWPEGVCARNDQTPDYYFIMSATENDQTGPDVIRRPKKVYEHFHSYFVNVLIKQNVCYL